MTKPASTPILAVISTLPVILGCALLGATEVRADYTVIIDQVGNNVEATGSGAFNTTGLFRGSVGNGLLFDPTITSGPGTLFAPGPELHLSTNRPGPVSDAWSGAQATGFFGSGVRTQASTSTGIGLGIEGSILDLPQNYSSGTDLGTSQNIWGNTTLANLGLTPGTTFQWTWGGGGPATNQSFTIEVVPGPIVGAGLPGLIAALGGLLAMARRRRRQFD